MSTRRMDLMLTLTALIGALGLGCPGGAGVNDAATDGAPETATEPPDRLTGGHLQCGNGEIDYGEDCDDGPLNSWTKHGCSPWCTTLRCGDGLVQAEDEDCDEEGGAGKQCSSKCRFARCGDGEVWEGHEECDQGDKEGEDDLSYNDGSYAGCNGDCTLAPHCGDGVVQDAFESCDEGTSHDGESCSHGCRAPFCGDGYLQPSVEECDDGNNDSEDWCTNDCHRHILGCGNGVVENTYGNQEECDDGNVVVGDGCSASCQLESCGDGVKDPSEGCDDGNRADDDGCNGLCQPEYCGDGIVQMWEKCDNGEKNHEGYNGCGTSCTLNPYCGDGELYHSEKCDDGNKISCDGCSAYCKVEECGNGKTECDEACDDGDWNGYECPAVCTLTCEVRFCTTDHLPND